MLLVCLDSLSGQILESRKIGSENHNEVRSVLKDIRRELGSPLAIVHALASWILAFSHSGDGCEFPFDIPYLNRYDRILEGHQVLCEARTIWPMKHRGPLGVLNRLKEILDAVTASDYTGEFCELVVKTKRDRKIFEQFRGALRICSKRARIGGTTTVPQQPWARHVPRRYSKIFGYHSKAKPRVAVHPRGPATEAGLLLTVAFKELHRSMRRHNPTECCRDA